MINNTARRRWERSAARNLDTAFELELIEGLNCSPIEARAIRDKVYELYAPLMETSEALKPGQLRLAVIGADVAPNIPLARARQQVVTLTLDAGEEDRGIRKAEGVAALRRHRLVRVCEEAFQQGGLLTLEAVADLFNCAVRTLVTDLAAVRARGITPPLRSTVKDMGRAVTHRKEIVRLWLAGLEYTEIGRRTYHSVNSVGNYVEKYKRCYALSEQFDVDTIAVIARLSPALVRAYQELARESEPVAYRREELASFLKKNAVLTNREAQS